MKKKVSFYPIYLFLMILILSGDAKGQVDHTYGGFKTGSLAEAKINEVKITTLTNEITTGNYNIHSLLIVRNNRLVYERYFTGSDEVLTVPAGVKTFSKDSLHDCRSLTKSIISTCIGVALAQGKIKSVNDKALSYLPKYASYDTGIKHEITIEHLLTMSAGLEWNENIPYSNPQNSEIQMLNQKDVIEFVLSRASVEKPGTEWNYSAGCTQLLAEILREVTGEKIDSFAKKYIFEPLDIKDFHWYERLDGTPWAPSGLRLRPIDMAKIGWLYLNDGQWDNKRILPKEWVKMSLQWHLNARSTSQGYGYQFWCTTATIAGKQMPIAMAIGFGGQRIYLIPQMQLEIVVTAGNYNQLTDLPDKMVFQYIFPAIEE